MNSFIYNSAGQLWNILDGRNHKGLIYLHLILDHCSGSHFSDNLLHFPLLVIYFFYNKLYPSNTSAWRDFDIYIFLPLYQVAPPKTSGISRELQGTTHLSSRCHNKNLLNFKLILKTPLKTTGFEPVTHHKKSEHYQMNDIMVTYMSEHLPIWYVLSSALRKY